MRIAICDDDIVYQRIIARITQEVCAARKLAADVYCFSDAASLLREVESGSGVFDIYLLDIEMPVKDGVALSRELRQLDRGCKIVFVTAYNDEVYKAFHYKADAFVPKDKLGEHLADELNSVIDETLSGWRPEPLFFDVEMPRGTRFDNMDLLIHLQPSEILYFESSNRQVFLHATGGTFTLLRRKYVEIVNEFEVAGFIAVHRCFLVNFSHVQAIGKHDIILDNGEAINLSRRMRRQVIEQYMKRVRGKLE